MTIFSNKKTSPRNLNILFQAHRKADHKNQQKSGALEAGMDIKSPEVYLKRAEDARAAAAAEPLAHVRQKHLDAAAAWDRMALPPSQRITKMD